MTDKKWRDPVVLGGIIASVGAAIISSIVAPVVVPSLTSVDSNKNSEDSVVTEKAINKTAPPLTTGGYTSDESTSSITTGGNTPDSAVCNNSYPDFCIGPDVDCKDIIKRNFRVLEPDPYNFDIDGNGRGCEE